MNWSLLIDNLTNPALLFFLLGVVAVQIKSDLTIPETSSKFISLYLLFAIGFEGGQEMVHSPSGAEFAKAAALGIGLAVVVPIYVFFIARTKFTSENAGAIAAAYGSISAVTFVTAVSLLEAQDIPFHGHLVAVMALMEAPAIVVGVFMKERFGNGSGSPWAWKDVIRHALTNGSVVLILGSLLIGATASEEQAQGIHPFTTDLFKGFLAIFLLDMGLVSGRGLKNFSKHGLFAPVLATVVPLANGAVTAWLTGFWFESPGDRFLFSILAASASYIAVPAAMRLAAPQAQPGLYIPMALAVTFPVNLTLGFPLYQAIIN